MLEFVNGLPAAVDTLEIPVDGCGRTEVCDGRVRNTFYRKVRSENGLVLFVPAVCTVWTATALLRAQANFIAMFTLVRNHPEVALIAHPLDGVGLH